jgi:hypothetical protein
MSRAGGDLAESQIQSVGTTILRLLTKPNPLEWGGNIPLLELGVMPTFGRPIWQLGMVTFI